MVKSFLDEIIKLSKVKALGKGLKELLRKNKKTLSKERVVTPYKGVLTGGQQRFTRSKKEIDKALNKAQGATVDGVTYSHKRVEYSKGKFKYKKKTKDDILNEMIAIKTANTNVDGGSPKNINSNTKPAKVPIRKNTVAKQEPNKVKPLKSNAPKYAFFKGADDPSKKPDPKPQVTPSGTEVVREIMKKYPPVPSGPKVTEEERSNFLLDQKWHKEDLKVINKHQNFQINWSNVDATPGDSISFRQILKPKVREK